MGVAEEKPGCGRSSVRPWSWTFIQRTKRLPVYIVYCAADYTWHHPDIAQVLSIIFDNHQSLGLCSWGLIHLVPYRHHGCHKVADKILPRSHVFNTSIARSWSTSKISSIQLTHLQWKLRLRTKRTTSHVPVAEVTDIVKQLLNGRVYRVDEIHPEFLKAVNIVELLTLGGRQEPSHWTSRLGWWFLQTFFSLRKGAGTCVPTFGDHPS